MSGVMWHCCRASRASCTMYWYPAPAQHIETSITFATQAHTHTQLSWHVKVLLQQVGMTPVHANMTAPAALLRAGGTVCQSVRPCCHPQARAALRFESNRLNQDHKPRCCTTTRPGFPALCRRAWSAQQVSPPNSFFSHGTASHQQHSRRQH